jgi:hypothetical protein
MDHTDYLKYYHLEKYLFNDVSNHFRTDGHITAFDFFCIVIWKANRSKSKIANRLLDKKLGQENLDSAAKVLTSAIFKAESSKQRLEIIMKTWGFRLPMASAILTVLYPDEFTVYDVRVCEMLQAFKDVQHKSHFDDIWCGYEKYVQTVKNGVIEQAALRDKDRWLWGKSFASQLESDIANKFCN